MGMAAPIYWTREMVLALPEDGNRYETVHGELFVSPAPRVLHEVVRTRLMLLVGNYLESQPVGQLFGIGDISWGDDTLVQPDLFVVPLEEARTMIWASMQSLMIAVEVLSPSSVRADRFAKRRLYQEVGIPVYWVVDADTHSVEVWTPVLRFPVTETERLNWQPTGASTPLVIELHELFRPL